MQLLAQDKDQPANQICHLLGIGIGPFNLSLAALAKPVKTLDTVFVDQKCQFDWHPGLLLDHAQLQVPFIADLVTFADPKNEFSFLNYLHHHQRLYKFYFRENFNIPRQEYNHYCQWVCAQLPNLYFDHQVQNVTQCIYQDEKRLCVQAIDRKNNQQKTIIAQHLSIGIGTEPDLPKILATMSSPYIRHSADFLHDQPMLKEQNAICIIGSGQSAAEIVLTLLNECTHPQRQLIWITRSAGFFPMEYSKLGLEHFSPEYMNYFYHLEDKQKKHAFTQQDLMYKGISHKTITEIYEKLYQLSIANQSKPLTLMSHSELQSINQGDHHRFSLQFKQQQTDTNFNFECDAVICATGYRPRSLDFLKGIASELITNENQTYALNADFTIRTKRPMPNKIFMQNNSLFSHGIGSPDLGLVCHRNTLILNQISNQTCYPVAENSIFQNFDTVEMSSKHYAHACC